MLTSLYHGWKTLFDFFVLYQSVFFLQFCLLRGNFFYHFLVSSRAWRSPIKIRRNFRFCPVSPGLDFVRPFFARFCPFFAQKWAKTGKFGFVCFCLNSPEFARFHSSCAYAVRHPLVSSDNMLSKSNNFVGISIFSSQSQHFICSVLYNYLKTYILKQCNIGFC